jgi:putative redox protein
MTKTHLKSGYVVDVHSGSHEFISDVDAKLGGTDAGPGPHELLESALAACTTITVQMYANRKGWKLTSCDATVRFTKEDKESIVIERVIEFHGELDQEQRKRLLEIADKCPIHEVLARGVKIESRLS